MLISTLIMMYCKIEDLQMMKTFQFQSDLEAKASQDWSLVSERSLYRDIRAGSTFQLRQGDVSLLCTVQVRCMEHTHLNCYALYN